MTTEHSVDEGEHDVSGGVVVLDLTVLPNSDSPYGDLIRSMCTELVGVHGGILHSYWTLGSLLHSFVAEQIEAGDPKNITKMLNNLSCDMYSVSGGRLDYSHSTLRNMLKFRESINEEQLERMQALGVPIRKALAMCVREVSNDDRTAIIEDLETGALDSSAVPERVQAIRHPDAAPELDPDGGEPATPTRGPFKAASDMQKAITKAQNLVERELMLTVPAVFSAEDDSDALPLMQKLTTIDNMIDALNRVWETLYQPYVTEEEGDDV